MKNLLFTFLLIIPFAAFAQIINEKGIRVESSSLRQLKDAPKKVYFQEFSTDYHSIIEANTTGFNKNTSNKISIAADLDSILSEMDIQSIADEAYKSVALKLTGAGSSLVSQVETKTIDGYQKRIKSTVGSASAYLNGYVYTSPTQSYYRCK